MIEYRWADQKADRLPAVAAELVRLNVDVIVAQATLPVAAAKRTTSTIPIVMGSSRDPVGDGLVASLGRRGGERGRGARGRVRGPPSSIETGGLMYYGPSTREMYRRAAYYVDRIFKGAKPADLPVEQPTTFEFVINMKIAK